VDVRDGNYGRGGLQGRTPEQQADSTLNAFNDAAAVARASRQRNVGSFSFGGEEPAPSQRNQRAPISQVSFGEQNVASPQRQQRYGNGIPSHPQHNGSAHAAATLTASEGAAASRLRNAGSFSFTHEEPVYAGRNAVRPAPFATDSDNRGPPASPASRGDAVAGMIRQKNQAGTFSLSHDEDLQPSRPNSKPTYDHQRQQAPRGSPSSLNEYAAGIANYNLSTTAMAKARSRNNSSNIFSGEGQQSPMSRKQEDYGDPRDLEPTAYGGGGDYGYDDERQYAQPLPDDEDEGVGAGYGYDDGYGGPEPLPDSPDRAYGSRNGPRVVQYEAQAQSPDRHRNEPRRVDPRDEDAGESASRIKQRYQNSNCPYAISAPEPDDPYGPGGSVGRAKPPMRRHDKTPEESSRDALYQQTYSNASTAAHATRRRSNQGSGNILSWQ